MQIACTKKRLVVISLIRVKFVGTLINKFRENMSSDFWIQNDLETVIWEGYFKIVYVVRTIAKMNLAKNQKYLGITPFFGFFMNKSFLAFELEEMIQPISDAFTEEEAWGVSDSDKKES